MANEISTYRNCAKCRLSRTRTQIVWGSGSLSSRLVLVGEAPGENEDKTGVPFVGKAGQELDEQYLARFAKIPRDQWYVTNIVKCRPPKNRDPKPEEVAACRNCLQLELDQLQPRVIGALGRFATRYLLGDVNMENVHGIPHRLPDGSVCVPCYHPASGLHDPSNMIRIQRDFETLGQAARGQVSPEDFKDEYPQPVYLDVRYLYSKFGRGYPFNHVAFDTETFWNGKLYSVQVSDQPGTASVYRWSNWGRLIAPKEYPMPFKINPGSLIVVHNALFDLPLLEWVGVKVNQHQVLDTMVMAYLLQDEPLGLKALAYRHCGMKMTPYDELIVRARQDLARQYLGQAGLQWWPDPPPRTIVESGVTRTKQPWNIGRKIDRILKDHRKNEETDLWRRWHNIDLEERAVVEDRLGPMPMADLSRVGQTGRVVEYAARDADATLRVFPKLWTRVRQYGLEDVFWMDMAIIPIVLDMMKNGMKVDPQELSRLSDSFGVHMQDVEQEIRRITGELINPASPQQVGDLLYRNLGLPVKKLSKKSGNPSTDQKYLEQIKDSHPVVGEILKYRKFSKLKSTYCDKLLYQMDDNCRVHPQILTTRTTTGRLASKNPNLQNIPVRSSEGRAIRKAFIADEDCVLVSCDYSQIELRTLAHESQDAVMLEVYRKGQDLHSRSASEIFGIPEDQLDPYEHRRPAKTCNFAVVYGISPQGLRDSLAREGANLSQWTLDRCEEFIKQWFGVFPGVRAYMRECELHARRYGYVKDMFGRIRRIPEVRSSLPYIVSSGIREAGNMPIQSGAQGIMKIAMAKLIPEYRRFGSRVRPLIQVHDDVIWEVLEWVLETWVPRMVHVMEHAYRLSVPTPVDPKVGRAWGDMGDMDIWRLNIETAPKVARLKP